MITVLHGDNSVASRNELASRIAAEKSRELRRFDGMSILDETALIQAIESHSLFGETPLVVIERLFSKMARQPKKIALYSEILIRSAKEADILLWEDKPLSPSITKQFPPSSLVLFSLPVLLFRFLDSLAPKKGAALLPLYQDVCKKEPVEVVYTLLLRRVRELLIVKDGGSLESGSPWQVKRLTAQAGFFTIDGLVTLHTTLVDMDIAIKTGSSPFSLGSLVQQWILSL